VRHALLRFGHRAGKKTGVGGTARRSDQTVGYADARIPLRSSASRRGGPPIRRPGGSPLGKELLPRLADQLLVDHRPERVDGGLQRVADATGLARIERPAGGQVPRSGQLAAERAGPAGVNGPGERLEGLPDAGLSRSMDEQTIRVDRAKPGTNVQMIYRLLFRLVRLFLLKRVWNWLRARRA
jgi:hypothetical protein